MVMPPEIYALRTPTPWTDWPDPGPHPAAAQMTVEQGNLRALFEANKTVYDSQQNVKHAVTYALNKTIPQVFRKSVRNQIGNKVFTIRNDPMGILQNLRIKYGACTPAEKTASPMEPK
jgi:hypothetical protein